MTAREEVLSRVRRAIGDRIVIEVPRDYHHGDETPASVATFVDRLLDYRAVVHEVTVDEVGPLLAGVLPAEVLVPEGFPQAWLGGLEVVRDFDLTAVALDRLPSVLTTCAVAIAETGTIVLNAGPGQGRRALTLVPDHHVVIVEADQVVASVPQALAELDPRRPQTWISGPSATSDIELQRVEGVHGPRRLEVVIVRRV